MLVRARKLVKNQKAIRLEEIANRTVNQRPPKNTAPSSSPHANATTSGRCSRIGSPLFIPHRLVLVRDPVPRIHAPDHKSGSHERQRPRVLPRMMLIKPEAKPCAEQRWNR